ncbi:unnamed protein product, partial [Choristocarpus tenellus]
KEVKKLTPEDYILPEGWIVAFSKKEKRSYFFNTTTGVSVWTAPSGSKPKHAT